MNAENISMENTDMNSLDISGVASIGARGQSVPLTAKKLSKSGKREEKSGENQKKRKNWEEKAEIEVLSLCPLLANRAGYAIA